MKTLESYILNTSDIQPWGDTSVQEIMDEGIWKPVDVISVGDMERMRRVVGALFPRKITAENTYIEMTADGNIRIYSNCEGQAMIALFKQFTNIFKHWNNIIGGYIASNDKVMSFLRRIHK